MLHQLVSHVVQNLQQERAPLPLPKLTGKKLFFFTGTGNSVFTGKPDPQRNLPVTKKRFPHATGKFTGKYR